ncbi:MAG TPA: hypothetical protein PLN18_02500, partial [Candidatus Colwellbacteria bacterium]|nr:hypothetical protein [Candidatus Colwellbacteria bacterium]
EDFEAEDTLIINGLKIIGHTGAKTPGGIKWGFDGVPTYVAVTSGGNITVSTAGDQDALAAVSVVPYDPVTGATTTYAVNFTVPAGGVIPHNGKIKITFPAEFDITNADISSASGIDGTFTAADAGQVLTITRTGTGINSLAGAKTLNLTTIVNGATGAAHTATVTTTTVGDATLASLVSPAFTILAAPAAINNLTCESSGQAGAIWLRWTVPAGVSDGYTVKHSLAAIGDAQWAGATEFTQSWTDGIKAASKQELVTGLNPNTRYYFAMKSSGAGGTESAISTTSPSCIAPSSAPSNIDNTAPVTLFTSPGVNSTVASGSVIIRGTARDTGGSSVQKVEVSLDNGTTWSQATITEDEGNNRIWYFEVTNASVGTMTVRARATDWANNIETNSPTLTFNVSSTGTPTAPITPSEPTIPSVPSGATPDQIRAAITSIQQQLIVLIGQLIQQLVAQLQAML